MSREEKEATRVGGKGKVVGGKAVGGKTKVGDKSVGGKSVGGKAAAGGNVGMAVDAGSRAEEEAMEEAAEEVCMHA